MIAGVPVANDAHAFVELAPALILPSKTNPRKTFAGIAELAASLREHGVLQPLLVRPKGNAFELVFGERRLRAAKLAELERIPAEVRELTDAKVEELQLVENSQREDIHPIEEADGYQRLQEVHGLSTEDIAARVGKPIGVIRQRLTLCRLLPEARKAVFDGEIEVSVALMLARIPHSDLQRQALEEVRRRRLDQSEGPISLRDAAWTIKTRFMLRIVDAKFDLADAGLVPSAPTCTTCTKRTGNQTELFAGVASHEDLCTDAKCFEAKKEAHWARITAAAKKNGTEVLSARKAKEVFTYGGHVESKEFVDLEASTYNAKGNRVENKTLMGKAKDVPRVIARDDAGNVRELVRAEDFNAAVRAAGNARTGPSAKAKASTKAAREKAAQEKAKRDELIALVIAGAEGAKAFTDQQWRCIARCAVGMAWSDVHREVCRRRELAVDRKKKRPDQPNDVLAKAIDAMDGRLARGLIVEVAMLDARSDSEERLRELAEAFAGVKAPEKKKRAARKGPKR